MKKLYILSVALLVGGLAMGQGLNKKFPHAPKNKTVPVAAIPNTGAFYKANNTGNPSPMATIWSDDFSVASNWTIANGAGNSDNWKIRTLGPGGSFAIATIASTTAANGFALFDSDSLCSGNQIANITTANSINLTGKANVVLEFQQYYRRWSDSTYVYVSNNNTTWDLYPVNVSVATNGYSGANPTVTSVNISATAGNKATVWIRFTFYSPSSFPNSPGCGYSWMVDDVAIKDAPANDLALSDIFYHTYSDSTSMKYYTRIPSKQAAVDTLTFGAYLQNKGTASQPNTKLKVNVTGVQTSIDSSTAKAEPAGAFDSVNVTTNFFMPVKGNYNLNFNISSDSTDANPSDNSRKDTIIVTDTVYARDNNMAFSGGWYGTTAGTTYIIGNLFKIGAQDTATSVSVFIGGFAAPNDQLNKVMNFKLYDFNGTTPVEMASNDFYNVTAADKGKWKTLPLTPVAPYTSTALTPGFYLAAFESQSDSVLFVTGATDPVAPILTTFVSVSTNPGSWGYATSIPFIRMNTQISSCASFAASTTIANVTCNGLSNGSVTLSTTGGTGGPYTYMWSNNATTQNLSNVAAGTYTVTVTDAGGCIAVKTANVTQPTAITATVTSNNTTCGNSNGSVAATASGGVAPLTYLWSSGQTTASVTGLAAGTYSVTVTDSKQCTKITSATINASTAVAATTSSVNATCGQTDGSATVTATAGGTSYTYAWSSNAANQTTATATGLGAGSYSVTVTANGVCTGTFSANVNNAGAPSVTVTSSTPSVTCNGGTNGAVNITVSGGATPYTFLWSNGASTEDISGVAAGTYTVNVAGSDGCLTVSSTTITQPPAINATVVATAASCFGGNDGAINLLASGGTGSLSFLWSNTDTTEDITGLTAGTYTVTITDDSACTKTASATVTAPTAINAVANITNSTNVNNNNGAVNLTTSGGTAPFTYLWSNGATTSSITGLSGPTTYYVTVTDSKGCTKVDSAFVDHIVGISELNIPTSYNVFPNPGNGVFNVQFSNAKGQYGIIVRNVVGQVVYADRATIVGNSIKQIDLSNIAQGIYFMSVSGADVNKTTKLIIK